MGDSGACHRVLLGCNTNVRPHSQICVGVVYMLPLLGLDRSGMSKYKDIKDNEWHPVHAEMRVMCCDCGLVHDYEYKIDEDERVFIRSNRNNRATATARRRQKIILKYSDG